MLKHLKLRLITWIQRSLQLDLRKKNYVSELDQFLADFRKKNPERSPNQANALAKSKKIARLRDIPLVRK